MHSLIVYANYRVDVLGEIGTILEFRESHSMRGAARVNN